MTAKQKCWKVITPVGTSVFDNYSDYMEKKRDKNNQIIGYINSLKNLDKDGQSPEKFLNTNSKITNRVTDAVGAWAVGSEKYPSAEIKSILKIKEHEDYKNKPLHVYLLATDTLMSILAAGIIKNVVQSKKTKNEGNGTQNAWTDIIVTFNTGKDIIKGLQVTEPEKFKGAGLSNLVERIKDIFAGTEKNTNFKNAIFNITGGYKALIPFLTVISQLYEAPAYYVFEDTEQLIKIPQLPLEFDFSYIEENYMAFELFNKKNLPSVEKFKNFLNIKKSDSENIYSGLEKKGLVETIEELPNEKKIMLTTFGGLLYNKYKEFSEEGTYYPQKMIGVFMELKIYKYYVNKCCKFAKVYHSYVLPNGKELDVLIELENKVIAIEVKPGANIPIDGKDGIENKLKDGGAFKVIYGVFPGKKMDLRVYCYHYQSIHPGAIEKIKKLHCRYPVETENLSWHWVKCEKEYKKNENWEVGKIKKIFP